MPPGWHRSWRRGACRAEYHDRAGGAANRQAQQCRQLAGRLALGAAGKSRLHGAKPDQIVMPPHSGAETARHLREMIGVARMRKGQALRHQPEQGGGAERAGRHGFEKFTIKALDVGQQQIDGLAMFPAAIAFIEFGGAVQRGFRRPQLFHQQQNGINGHAGPLNLSLIGRENRAERRNPLCKPCQCKRANIHILRFTFSKNEIQISRRTAGNRTHETQCRQRGSARGPQGAPENRAAARCSFSGTGRSAASE